ncbi:MAG: bifunctional folylpolyglutamate synthase/dihydrofolate synthase [Nitrospinota bacterium]|nr:bifunctional folylpolyglutamate synthase/dihydrofolate synthase [Nitrospinota bacterium]
MTPQEARRYLESLSFQGMKLGLDNTRQLLVRLGDPQKSYSVIHVGGTNGKGSTCAILSSILTAAGIANGLYTSPHQVTFHERIRVGAEMIEESEAADAISTVKDALENGPGLSVTYFEFLTAVAFLHFARAGVQAAVVEVGMGGRFDSTNVVDPAVCAITSVAMDHMFHLGDTLEKISMEKCGIIKPGRPVILGAMEGPALKVAMDTATERGSKALLTERDFSTRRLEMDRGGEAFSYRAGNENLENLFVGLLGRKQVENAGISVTAALALRERGFDIPDAAIRLGLETVKESGRFENVRKKPALIMDGAHNPAAAMALCETIIERHGPGRADIIFGAMRDKDYTAMLKALAPAARSFTCFSPNVPRAEDPKKLALAQKDAGIPTRVAGGLADVLSMIEKAGGDSLTIITGSFYTIGEVRAAMLGAMVEPD